MLDMMTQLCTCACTGEVNYNSMHNKSLYEVEYEGNHYQVLTEVTDHKKDDIAIAKVDGFIKSVSGNLHRNKTTCGCKLLV